MNTSILKFSEQIRQIKCHLEVFEKYEELIKIYDNEDVNFIKANRTQEKLFFYRSNIISLYGAFERFIEDVIREYISSVQDYIISFNEWGEKIANGYFGLWKELHKKLAYPKFASINETKMVDNLYKVICNKESSLIPECFLQNGGNYKPKIINEVFSNIGIQNINQQLLKHEPLRSYFEQQNYDFENIETDQKLKLCYQDLDDLVDRRNEIAHGLISDNILSIDLFRKILDFTEIYAKSVIFFLTNKVYEKKWIQKKDKAIKIDHVYREGKVAILNIDNIKNNKTTPISVGRRILVKYKEEGNSSFFMETNIEEIRIDIKDGGENIKLDEYLYEDNLEAISIKLSNKVKAKQMFIL